MRRFLSSAFFFLSAASLLSAGQLIRVTALPNQPTVTSMIRDDAGNLYLGGWVIPAHPKSQNDADAFIAKLSPTGQTLFWTVLSGSQSDQVNALAFAPDGSIVAAGDTQSPDFPVTSNAAQKTSGLGPNGDTGFFARLDTMGHVTYASYLSAIPSAMVVDSSGAAYLTGWGGAPTTAGTVPTSNLGAFVLKLDSNGKTVFATDGVGGTLIALDAQGNIYVAGVNDAEPIPITPGAFQPSVQGIACAYTSAIGFPCEYQYAAKLNPSATRLLYLTWLSGAHGAYPNALAVDADGNAVLAGTTQSADYPVTAGAFQTSDRATQPPLSNDAIFPVDSGPPITGYVTKLNSTGTALIFSTFLGGSAQDAVAALSVESNGNIDLSGWSQSADFPGLSQTPTGCRGSAFYPQAFTARLSDDGTSLLGAQITFGPIANAIPSPALSTVFFGDGLASMVVANPATSSASLATVSLNAPAPPYACAVDAADLAPLTAITPGQLITLFGNGIGGPSTSVKIHGIAAPVLYSSPSQINVQVPYEISGQYHATLEIDSPSGAIAGLQKYDVNPRQPSAFLTAATYSTCGNAVSLNALPVAHNADGSRNSCTNPAAMGSDVTIFVNALGAVLPSASDGGLGANPPAALPLPIQVYGNASLQSAESVPGSSNALWVLKLTVNPTNPGSDTLYSEFTLGIGGAPLRDSLVIWLK